jgi:probable HAF family extracellular repeat protein
MSHFYSRFLVSALAVVVGVTSFSVAAAGPTYRVTDLGALSTGSSNATGINAVGQVVGYSTSSTGQSHAFIVSAGRAMRDLGTLPGDTNSIANGINASGQVAGTSNVNVFIAAPNGSLQNIGTLAGATSSNVGGINASGQVAGDAFIDGSHAFLYSPGIGMQDIGSLGGTFSRATAINDLGQVVGASSAVGDLGTHAYIYQAGIGMRDLGTLGGSNSRALAINAIGQVAGSAATADESLHAFITTPGGVMQDLGILGYASSINLSGQAIGLYGGGSFFLYSPIYGVQNLQSLIDRADPSRAVITNVAGINDAGQIAANAQINGSIHAVLLSPSKAGPPIADPSTYEPQECTGRAGALISLDGSGSYDPDGEAIVSYKWEGYFGRTTGIAPTVLLPLGNNKVKLTVADATNSSLPVTTVVSVVDTIPPSITSLSVTLAKSWSPSLYNKMVPLKVAVSASDVCSASTNCKIISITSNRASDADKPVNWQITDDLTANVLAEKGRVYTISVKCKDATGNFATKTVTYSVP